MHRLEVKKENYTVSAFPISKTLGFAILFASADATIFYFTCITSKKRNCGVSMAPKKRTYEVGEEEEEVTRLRLSSCKSVFVIYLVIGMC